MKKLLSVILALAMVMSMGCFSCFAEDAEAIAEEIVSEEIIEEEVVDEEVIDEEIIDEEVIEEELDSEEPVEIELFSEEIEEVAEDEVVEDPTATVTAYFDDPNRAFYVIFTGEGNKQIQQHNTWEMDIEVTSNKELNLGNDGDAYISAQMPVMGWSDIPSATLGSITLNADEPLKVWDTFWAGLYDGFSATEKYSELFSAYSSFGCGMYIRPQVIKTNPDLKIEVALKIYDPKAIKAPITLASYTYMPAVAKVNETYFESIDDAIAAWTNGTTLTLLDDVQLSDVVKLKSTEHHNLNLGTYTLTAASGQHAIEITCEGRSDASYALTVNADSENPGGITATGKSCIYYKKSGSTKDRPIIRIYNGVFNGSYSINCTSNGNTNCPQVWIYGGRFNSYMNLTKTMLRVWGGFFDCSINCTGDQNAYRQFYGGTFKNWQFMTADAPNKFVVGSAKGADANTLGTYDVGVYVDENDYLVVGGDVITAPADNFGAHSTYLGWSSYLKYSSAAEYGLYYKNADIAVGDVSGKGSATVTLYEDCYKDVTSSGNLTIDCSAGAIYGGDVTLSGKNASFTIVLPDEDAEYRGTVTQSDSSYYLVVTEDEVNNTITYTQTTEPKKAGLDAYLTRGTVQTAYKFDDAIAAAVEGDKITLIDNVTYNIDSANKVNGANKISLLSLAVDEAVLIDLNGFTLSPENPTIPTFVAGEKYIITNGTIKGDVVVTGDVEIKNATIDGDIEIDNGNVEITSGAVSGTIVSNNNDNVEITGGKFTEDPTAFVADGYDVIRHADFYVVANLSAEAKSISVEFEKTDRDANFNDNLEGADTYNIVLKANSGDEIYELASADLTFKFAGTPVTGGAMNYTVAPADGMTLTQIKDRYMFNYDGATKIEESGTSIVIGSLTIDGYGKYTFRTVDADTNIVNATTVCDNLVDYYIKNGDKDTNAATGGLVINTDTDNADNMIGEITNGDIAVPTRELTINVTFPNAVEDNEIAYQDMKVEITGNIDGVNKTVTYNLGTDEKVMNVNGAYVVTNEDLVLNNAYTVTVSGAGYRTARYTVTMASDKELTFWNNVMDDEKVIEKGKDSSKTTKNFLAGDIVKDNAINIYDLSAVVSYFGQKTDKTAKDEYAKYDLNRDGVIDSKDVAYVLVSWGE